MWTNKLIYLAITIYAGVLAVLYTEVQALYIFLILLLLPLLLVLQLVLIKRKLTVSLQAKSKLAIEGEQGIAMSLTVENTAILPAACIKLYIIYENGYVDAQEKQVFRISVGGKSKKIVDFTIVSEHTGLVRVEVAKVKVYDFIRLFSRRILKDTTIAAEIPVLPEVYNIDSDVAIMQPDVIESDVFSKRKPGDDPSEVFDIREYKEGDRVHRIHWKLSSKKDTIMVKDYSLPIGNSAVILVDTSLPEMVPDVLAYMDSMLETVVAISYQLLIQGYTHYVAWYEQKESNYVSSNMEELDDLYYMLSSLLQARPTYERNTILEANQIYGGKREITKVYLVTHALEEEQISLLAEYYGHAQVEVLMIGEQHSIGEENDLGQGIHQQYVAITNGRSSIEALHL